MCDAFTQVHSEHQPAHDALPRVYHTSLSSHSFGCTGIFFKVKTFIGAFGIFLDYKKPLNSQYDDQTA